MTLFLLSPAALPSVAAESDAMPMPALDVTDSRDDHSREDGDGVWISPYLTFLEERAAELGRTPPLCFSNSDVMDEGTFEEIPQPYVRATLIEFTNEAYETWRRRGVRVPMYGEVAPECRSYCDECDSGWRDVEDDDGEVVDRDFVCESDCDGFTDHVLEAIVDRTEVDTAQLRQTWEEFQRGRREGGGAFPSLVRG